jgi:twitching motility protein PilU
MAKQAVEPLMTTEQSMADLPSILKQDVQSLFRQMVHKDGGEPEMFTLLRLMSRREGSDLFLVADAPPHLKVNGETTPLDRAVLKGSEVRTLVYSLMNKAQIADFETRKEANLAFALDGAGRFRVNVFCQRGNVAAVIRLIKSHIPSFDELGLPDACKDLSMQQRGLILFVGAAGSGKSTSLAAMIGHRSRNASGHILTIEDPVEFHFPHARSLVTQREVSIDTLSFSEALRNALREAPDVIVIGEIRDQETARHALTYSETGHLCLATLHSNNANQAIERILNFFPEAMHKQLLLDLSLNLRAVVSQRLIARADQSRALATELMLCTSYVSELIRRGRIEELKQAIADGGPNGMHTFDQSLFELQRKGLITQDEALRHADSQTDLAMKIRFAVYQVPNEVTIRDPGGSIHRRVTK